MNCKGTKSAAARLLAKYKILFERFEAHVDANLSTPLYNRDCASTLGMSPRSLSTVVQAVHGTSPQRYIRQRRLQAVRDEILRRKTSTPISSIATAYGFKHLGEFASEYRKQFGELPSETALLSQQPGSESETKATMLACT